jgi:hypothetical protein
MNERWWPWIWFGIGALLSELIYQSWGGDAARILWVVGFVSFLVLWVARRMDEHATGISWGYPLAAGFIVWPPVRLLISFIAFRLGWAS